MYTLMRLNGLNMALASFTQTQLQGLREFKGLLKVNGVVLILV